MVSGVTRPGDRARPQGEEKWVAGSAGAPVLGKGLLPLRVGLWSGAGAGFPLPALGTQLPSSSHLPAGQVLGHLWRENGSTEVPGFRIPGLAHINMFFPFPGNQIYSPHFTNKKAEATRGRETAQVIQLVSEEQFSFLTCLFFTVPSLHCTIWDPRPDPPPSSPTHQQLPEAGCAHRPCSPAELQSRHLSSHPAGPG